MNRFARFRQFERMPSLRANLALMIPFRTARSREWGRGDILGEQREFSTGLLVFVLFQAKETCELCGGKSRKVEY